jgi:hypothetical protein
MAGAVSLCGGEDGARGRKELIVEVQVEAEGIKKISYFMSRHIDTKIFASPNPTMSSQSN